MAELALKRKANPDHVPIPPRVRRIIKHAPKCPSGTKRGFKTRRKATIAAEYLARQFDKTFYIYRCPRCGHFHLSKEPTRKVTK